MANIAKICAGRLPALNKFTFGLQNIRTFASGKIENVILWSASYTHKKKQQELKQPSRYDATPKLCNFKLAVIIVSTYLISHGEHKSE